LFLLVAAPFTAAQMPAYPSPAEVRQAFFKLLDRPKVPLDVRLTETVEDGALVRELLSIASEKKADGTVERVPMLIIRPAKPAGKLPAVIVLHGTGGSAQAMAGNLKELANRGFVALAIDARYHGQRSGGAKGSAAYVEAITRAWQTKKGEPMEHPFYYDTVWDLWRTVDYLETRPDVNPKKIGMIGFSMGGIQTWLAASVDERIYASVPAIGVQSFRWSLDNDRWQARANTIAGAHKQAANDLGEPEVNKRVCTVLWNKIIPGILDQFDCPSMLRLFAGRPLLILNGTKDNNCPIEGARIAIASAEKAYKDAGASDKLKIVIEEVGHTVTPAQRQAALEWFETWLK
jgi:dienelactone hydrolase